MAFCMAQATTDFKGMLSPVLSTLDAAIQRSIQTVQPPPFRIGDEAVIVKLLLQTEYAELIQLYKGSDSLTKKLLILSTDNLSDFREAVVESAMEDVRVNLHAGSHEEATEIVRRSCTGLIRAIQPTLSEASAMTETEQRDIFLTSNQDLLKLLNIATFCKFL